MFKLNEEQKAKIKNCLEKGEEFCSDYKNLIYIAIMATGVLGFNISYKKCVNKTNRDLANYLVAELNKSK